MHDTIVFERSTGFLFFGGTKLYATDPHRTRVRLLRVLPTRDQRMPIDPVWSPSGTELAFVAFAVLPTSTNTLCTSRVDGHPPTPIARGNPRTPAWSPDGTQIAFAEGNSIFIVNRDGSDRLLCWRPDAEEAAMEAWRPTWSPDGAQIAFSLVPPGARQTDRSEPTPTSQTLVVVDRDGGHERRIGPLGARNPDWAPDGEKIAFDAYPDNVVNRGRQIFVSDPRGRRLTQLTDLQGAHAEGPSWAPDGQSLAFTRRSLAGEARGPLVPFASVSWMVHTISAAGSDLHRLVVGGPGVDWGVTPLAPPREPSLLAVIGTKLPIRGEVLVLGAVLTAGLAGGYWLAFTRTRKKVRSWRGSGIRVWGSRTL